MGEDSRKNADRGWIPPMSAVESVRTKPVCRAVFEQAMIVNVLEGRAIVETADARYELTPGSCLVLGASLWCSIGPNPYVRTWTLYVDEQYLRTQMSWLLPDPTRVLPGFHPSEWSGAAVVLAPGIEMLRSVESVWRQISVLDSSDGAEVMAARLTSLFARNVELAVPVLLNGGSVGTRPAFPVSGRLALSPLASHVRRAVGLLQTRMADDWTASSLASEIALSRAHLTRLFTSEVGIAPMRFLVETRLTEFTRLIEETDLALAEAARAVGWSDSRVATKWFRKRFGVAPSVFRRDAHPSFTALESCDQDIHRALMQDNASDVAWLAALGTTSPYPVDS
ncbi:MAG: AraC family transcriptional regulator [Microbacteriaceae bacterium]